MVPAASDLETRLDPPGHGPDPFVPGHALDAHRSGDPERAGVQGLTGFFGSTAWDVEFDRVNVVKVISETSGGRRRRTNYYLLFEMKAGGPVKVALGNELVKAAEEILHQVTARGIPVIDGR